MDKQTTNRKVVAVTATYRRLECLTRLGQSLKLAGNSIDNWEVVDNDANLEIGSKLKEIQIPFRHHMLPGNPGCGAALQFGLRAGLASFPNANFLFLDDDAELEMGCVDRLYQELIERQASVTIPLITNAQGEITSFGGLLEKEPWKQIRRPTPTAYLERCGMRPIAFAWCPGVCLLVANSAARALGGPRDDMWLMGEDLEFSLRLTNYRPGFFVPAARARHLPPQEPTVASEYIKRLAMLMNSAYLGFHVPYCRRLLHHLPGNIWKFLVRNHWSLNASYQVVRFLGLAYFKGASAGGAAFQHFRKKRTKFE